MKAIHVQGSPFIGLYLGSIEMDCYKWTVLHKDSFYKETKYDHDSVMSKTVLHV